MEFEFDPRKDGTNREKHGLSLAQAARMDLDAAQIVTDDRRSYGEARYRAVGFIDDRLCVMIFTMRGLTMRVISLRKANERERRNYDAGRS